MASQNFEIKKIEKLPDSEAEIQGEVSLDFLNICRVEALKHLNKSVKLPGFREGQVPEEVLIKTVGEMVVVEETAEIALAKEYGNIIEASKLKPMTRPQITITKLAPKIPLEFKMKVVVEPEFDLPDYKKVAKDVIEKENAEPKAPSDEKKEDAEKHEEKSLEKTRLKMMEAIIKATKLELPKRFIDEEVEHTLHHFRHDLENAGIKFDAYLEQIKKTEDEVKESWREQIADRAKSEMIFSKIAEKENLKTHKEVFELLEK